MNAEGAALSRRAFTAGALSAASVSAAKAQITSRDNRPPPLQTARSQFVELRPLKEVPPLLLERIDGKMVALNALRGRAVLVNFWATWCPPCHRELPLLDDLKRMTRQLPLEIVAVSIDQAGRQAVDSFLRQLRVTDLPLFLDPAGRVGKKAGSDAPTPFVLWGMPISYTIDRRGRLAGYITGEVDWMSDEAQALLKYYTND
jgi:thiol-disulfide isomerase/thioredoxin